MSTVAPTSNLAPAKVAVALPAVHETFLQKIKDAEHTFTAWWAKEYAAFKKEEPKIQQVVDATAKYAIPALDIALAAAGGPAGVGVGVASGIADAQLGLSVASGLVNDFGPTPSAASVVSGVSDNLSGILKLAQVKNPKSIDAITKVQGEVSALSTALSAAVSAQSGSGQQAPAPSQSSAAAPSTSAS